jgi:hypothetical protein
MDGNILFLFFLIGLLVAGGMWVGTTLRSMSTTGWGFLQAPLMLKRHNPLSGALDFLGLFALGILLGLGAILSLGRR